MPRIDFQSAALSPSSRQIDSSAILTAAGGFAIDRISTRCCLRIPFTAARRRRRRRRRRRETESETRHTHTYDALTTCFRRRNWRWSRWSCRAWWWRAWRASRGSSRRAGRRSTRARAWRRAAGSAASGSPPSAACGLPSPLHTHSHTATEHVASDPARHLYKGAVPWPYRLAPCPNSLALCPIYIAPCPKQIEKNKKKCRISVFVFSDSWWTVQCLKICAHVFIDRPQNCAQISFRSRAGLCPNFGRSRVKADLVVSSAQSSAWLKFQSIIDYNRYYCVPCCASMTAGSTWASSEPTLSCFSAMRAVCSVSATWISWDATFFRSASCWSFTWKHDGSAIRVTAASRTGVIHTGSGIRVMTAASYTGVLHRGSGWRWRQLHTQGFYTMQTHNAHDSSMFGHSCYD